MSQKPQQPKKAKASATRSAPLVNTQTKHIPVGPKLSNVLSRETKYGEKQEGDFGEAEEGVQRRATSVKMFAMPSLHSTTSLLKQIQITKEEDPDLSVMADEKLMSPTTAKTVAKKVSRKVNVGENKEVYRDLLAADVSSTAILCSAEADLKKRAITTKPAVRPRDPLRKVEDYFRKEDYLFSAVCEPDYDRISKSSVPVEPIQADTKFINDRIRELIGDSYLEF